MIKSIVVISILISLSFAFSFKTFDKMIKSCSVSLDSCQYDPYYGGVPLNDEEL